jgi:demethylmenaquinone methyltransferase/2-methoxy-6-polyprenyl-1,4-benzoquinol methylase
MGLLQYSRWHDFLLSRLDLPPQGHVLDMATGTGALAVRLARLDGLRVTGGDITRRMLLQTAARSNGRVDLVECTAEAAPFADGAFDAVIFTYLLRYVADVPATLAELARALKPGGTMASLDFAVPRGIWYPLWRLYTAVGLPLGGALLSPAWRRVGAFLGPSIRGFYRRWPEERLLQLWRESGFPDAQAKRLSLGGAIVTWGTKQG